VMLLILSIKRPSCPEVCIYEFSSVTIICYAFIFQILHVLVSFLGLNPFYEG
jgi:hypothetical protein